MSLSPASVTVGAGTVSVGDSAAAGAGAGAWASAGAAELARDLLARARLRVAALLSLGGGGGVISWGNCQVPPGPKHPDSAKHIAAAATDTITRPTIMAIQPIRRSFAPPQTAPPAALPVADGYARWCPRRPWNRSSACRRADRQHVPPAAILLRCRLPWS